MRISCQQREAKLNLRTMVEIPIIRADQACCVLWESSLVSMLKYLWEKSNVVGKNAYKMLLERSLGNPVIESDRRNKLMP